MRRKKPTGRIVVDPRILVGKPVILGTRISVEHVVDLMSQGWSEDQVIAEYDHLTRADVRACLAYAGAVLRSEMVYPKGS
jgi:uncharacterized protein (DUF433 family)